MCKGPRGKKQNEASAEGEKIGWNRPGYAGPSLKRSGEPLQGVRESNRMGLPSFKDCSGCGGEGEMGRWACGEGRDGLRKGRAPSVPHYLQEGFVPIPLLVFT